MGFLSENELRSLGLGRLGRGVRLSDKASLHNPAMIEIGEESRIDDFCVLSAGPGGIAIGSHVHLAVHCSLIGAGRIEMHDFSGLSAKVSVFSSNDDYSGAFLTGPTVPAGCRRVTSAPVIVGRHVVVGAGAVVLPGVTLHEGAGVGALSLVKRDCEAFGMYAGVPARRVGRRSRDLLVLERALLDEREDRP